MLYVRCRPEHIALIDPQPGQEHDKGYLLSLDAWVALENSFALSAFAGGLCVGAAGIVEEGGFAYVWALLSRKAGPHMTEITRKVARVLSTYPAGSRLRTMCDERYPSRGKWVRMLGFSRVGFEYHSALKTDLGVYEKAI